MAIKLGSSRVCSISYFYSLLGGFTEGNVTMTFFGSTEVDLDFSSLA